MSAKRRQRGVTIIELMIVITIVGILAAVAVPAFDTMIKDNRRTTVANELVSSLMLARAESVKRGQAVTVCANTSGGGASCTGGGTYDYGWMVFVDPNADGAIAAAADRIRSYVNDYSDIRIRSTAVGTNGYVVLRPFNQGSTPANIVICDKRGASKARVVVIEQNGRSRIGEKDSSGNAPTCP